MSVVAAAVVCAVSGWLERSLCRDSRGLGGVFGVVLMLVTGRERRRRTGSGLFQTDSGSGFCFGMRFGLCEVCVLAVLITFI